MTDPTNWLVLEKEAKWHPTMRRPFNCPLRFKDAQPDGIPDDLLRGMVRRYLREFWTHAPQGVAPCFVGKARSYKSYAAAVIGRWVANAADVETWWIDCGDDLMVLERQRYEDATQEYIAWLKQVPFLIMDDFTNVREKTWAADLMVEIATARFNSLRPTLYTGNVLFTKDDLQRLAGLYGACLARRIFDGADGFRYVLPP